MTLRRPRKGSVEPKYLKVYYEQREDLKEYVEGLKRQEEEFEARGEVRARTQSQIIDDAVEQDKILDQRLSPHQERMETFADAQKLALRNDLPEVIARLVELGLDAWEKRHKK